MAHGFGRAHAASERTAHTPTEGKTVERITQSDLANRLAALRTAAVSAGLTEAERWHVDIGSKTYGRAYRLWLKHTDYPSHSGHYSPIVHDYLGMTANEAYATMGTLLDAFHAVASVRKGSYHDHTADAS